MRPASERRKEQPRDSIAERMLSLQSKRQVTRVDESCPLCRVLRTRTFIWKRIACDGYFHEPCRDVRLHLKKIEKRETVGVLVVRSEPWEVAVHAQVFLDTVQGALDERPSTLRRGLGRRRAELGVIGFGLDQHPLVRRTA